MSKLNKNENIIYMYKAEFEVLKKMVGAMIGKGGKTVQGIRTRTGAHVHIHSDFTQSGQNQTYVEVRGQREQVI